MRILYSGNDPGVLLYTERIASPLRQRNKQGDIGKPVQVHRISGDKAGGQRSGGERRRAMDGMIPRNLSEALRAMENKMLKPYGGGTDLMV